MHRLLHKFNFVLYKTLSMNVVRLTWFMFVYICLEKNTSFSQNCIKTDQGFVFCIFAESLPVLSHQDGLIKKVENLSLSMEFWNHPCSSIWTENFEGNVLYSIWMQELGLFGHRNHYSFIIWYLDDDFNQKHVCNILSSGSWRWRSIWTGFCAADFDRSFVFPISWSVVLPSCLRMTKLLWSWQGKLKGWPLENMGSMSTLLETIQMVSIQ